MSATIEMVSFKLSDGVTSSVFLNASESVDRWVAKKEGF